MHHWKDQVKGFSECKRIARSTVVFLTIDVDVCAKFWLFDYFPELLRVDRQIFPSITRFQNAFGSLEAIAVPRLRLFCHGRSPRHGQIAAHEHGSTVKSKARRPKPDGYRGS
jgi:hypothetical protein